MKKFTLSFAFALSIAFTGFTSNNAVAATGSNTSVNDEAKVMAQKIGLNEGEYITFRNLSQEKISKTAEIEDMYSNDPEMLNMKLTEMNAHFEARFTAVLNPKQLEAYAAYKSSENTATIASATEKE